MKIVKLYALLGFVVRCVMMDMEFEAVKAHLPLAEINTTAAREHVGEAERFIRTIKERCRCLVADLVWSFLHRSVIIHMVYFAVTMLNVPVAANGISRELSPREIVLGKRFEATKHCRARFGAYVEASEDADVTNDMSPRKEPCICLGPSGNWQGSVKCFKIENAKVVTRRTIKVLPMPDSYRKAMDLWGKVSKKTSTNKLEFLNRSREKFEWDNGELDISEMKVVPEVVNPHPEIPAEFPGVRLESDYDGLHPAIEPAPVLS